MKKILATLILLTFIGSAFAITPTELEQANEILTQMDSKISALRGYVQRAYAGEVEGITLTVGQREELKQKYLVEKQELVALYNQLP